MRILMISDFYHPYLGGVEQHVRSLGTALVARGHEVAVATLRGDQLPRFEVDRGVRVHRLDGVAQRIPSLFHYTTRPWAPPVTDPGVLWSLRKIVAVEQPQIVHGHDWLVRSFLPLKRSSKAALVVSLHYYTLTCAKKNLMFRGEPCSGPQPRKCLGCCAAHYGWAKGSPTLLGNWAFSAMERELVDAYLPVSGFTALGNELANHDARSAVIPNFIADDIVHPNDRAQSRDIGSYVAQLPDTGFLLFVGDLRREKGLPVVLAAYAGLADPPPLVLIGKAWDDTPTTFPPNTILLGEWPHHAVMEAWRRCTLGIVPSTWNEPFGIVLLEAMACGRPVVASRVGGIPEIVVDGETGLLVPPGDPVALREAITRLLADPCLRATMGDAARRRVCAFLASTVVPRIEAVYERLLRGRPGAERTGA